MATQTQAPPRIEPPVIDHPAEADQPVPDRRREPRFADFFFTHWQADGSRVALCGLRAASWVWVPWILTCPRCRTILETARTLAR
jgi:hypothetical protein